jgi:hypothetical protein
MNNNTKKKKIMKRIIQSAVVALVCLVAFSVSALADNDKPVNVNQLPATAQQTLKKHFSAKKVALAKMESGLFEKSYDVVFNNGEKVEFDRNGNWTEINCKMSSVPAGLVPAKITSYVKSTYPGTKILQIEKDDNRYEVKLSNRLEVTFNKNFQVVDIDD